VYPAGGTPVPALRGVSLAVAPGECVAITGPSGCGKTTLLHLLGGLDQPTSGTVRFDGAAFGAAPRRAAAQRRHLGFIFQSFGLLPALTAQQNVELPLALAGVAAHTRSASAEALLTEVGLADRARYLPEELSGGQRQRVAIARALVTTPSVVLADEPTGSLDTATAGMVMDLLFGLVRARHTSLLLVTHDRAVAARADHEIQLIDGRVVG
jgi:putative ABC transport system ATP-binding protein